MGEASDRITRTSGMNPWRAGCGESRTSGSEGGPRKRTGGNPGTAPRPDPYTYVRTWEGFCYVAFVIDAFSRMIVGWSLARHLRTDLPMEALDMALWRRGARVEGMVHHSDAGSQYTSLRYTERLEESGIAPSVGSVGDSYDNALAEATIGLYKAEMIEPRRPWRTAEEVELGTLEWVDWFCRRRLHGSIGDVPPEEFEAAYSAALASMPSSRPEAPIAVGSTPTPAVKTALRGSAGLVFEPDPPIAVDQPSAGSGTPAESSTEPKGGSRGGRATILVGSAAGPNGGAAIQTGESP